MKIAKFTTTFDDLFGCYFHRWNPPEDGIIETEVLCILIGWRCFK